MKKYEIEYLINLCDIAPMVMSGIVVKSEKDKKEILDMIAGRRCELVGGEIRFKNGNIISIIEPKGEIIRGKRAKMKPYIDDFEMNTCILDEFINKENTNLDDGKMIFVYSNVEVK